MRMIAVLIAALSLGTGQENTLTDEEKQAGWKLLFDGKSTDGILTRAAGGKGAGGGDDDIVTVEWKIVAGGNSGVLIRVVEQSPTSWHESIEMQVLDNTKWRHRSKKEFAGACYDMCAPAKDVTKPVGEWDKARLLADGNRIEHWLNGEKLLEYQIGSAD